MNNEEEKERVKIHEYVAMAYGVCQDCRKIKTLAKGSETLCDECISSQIHLKFISNSSQIHLNIGRGSYEFRM